MQNIYFFQMLNISTIMKSKMMEQDGIYWTIIAGVLLKHEECPWRNMHMRSVLHEETCYKSDYCCTSLHTMGFYTTNIEHFYKMPFEIPFSMFTTY